MNIALDVDGVLRDVITKLLEIYAREYHPKENVTPDDITEWDLDKKVFVRGGVERTFFRNRRRAEEIFYESKPYEANVSSLVRKLRQKNHVYIITNQLFGNERITISWLKKYDVGYDGLLFLADKNLLRADILLDDNVHNLCYFTGRSVCRNQPWNKAYEGERVSGLEVFVRLYGRGVI